MVRAILFVEWDCRVSTPPLSWSHCQSNLLKQFKAGLWFLCGGQRVFALDFAGITSAGFRTLNPASRSAAALDSTQLAGSGSKGPLARTGLRFLVNG